MRLTEIFRQAQESLIVSNAHAVNKGEELVLDAVDKDFFFLTRENAQQTAFTVTDLLKRRLPLSYGEMGRRGVQVIAPTRRGPAGTENLNIMLRDALNPKDDRKAEMEIAGRLFREGDKVMQTRNNYELSYKINEREGRGIFNGDIGTIVRFDSQSGGAQIKFDDKLASYDASDFDDIELAYAITVHKSQGSEYPIVVMPVAPCAPMLQTKNMLYTAITRAKNIVILVGSKEILNNMAKNDICDVRYSGLARRIKEYYPE